MVSSNSVSTKGAPAPFVASGIVASGTVRDRCRSEQGRSRSVGVMSRPTRFEDFRYLGDKRRQVVYDLDADDPRSVERVAALLESEQFAAFAPDTLVEARNRGYRPDRSVRARTDPAGPTRLG